MNWTRQTQMPTLFLSFIDVSSTVSRAAADTNYVQTKTNSKGRHKGKALWTKVVEHFLKAG